MLECSSCGFSHAFQTHSFIETEKVPKTARRETGVVTAKNTYATFHHPCSKCGFPKAEIIDEGVWYSDEDNVLLLKCGKCGFVERMTSKVG